MRRKFTPAIASQLAYAYLPILLIIIMGRGTTKGKATPSCSSPRKPASTGPAAEYAVGSGSVGY